MTARTLIEATPDEIKPWRTYTAFYFGATAEGSARLPVGAVYGVVKSPHTPPTPGHHSANRWTYTRFKIVENNRGRWHEVDGQRFLTDEEIAHFEARLAAEFR